VVILKLARVVNQQRGVTWIKVVRYYNWRFILQRGYLLGCTGSKKCDEDERSILCFKVETSG
jgi:hypothetical protein